jgi:hypothetical protein
MLLDYVLKQTSNAKPDGFERFGSECVIGRKALSVLLPLYAGQKDPSLPQKWYSRMVLCSQSLSVHTKTLVTGPGWRSLPPPIQNTLSKVCVGIHKPCESGRFQVAGWWHQRRGSPFGNHLSKPHDATMQRWGALPSAYPRRGTLRQVR